MESSVLLMAIVAVASFILGAGVAFAILGGKLSASRGAEATLRGTLQQMEAQAAEKATEHRQQMNDAMRREADLRHESEKLWQERLTSLKAELSKTAATQMADSQRGLSEANKAQVGELLTPIREQFEALQKTIAERKTQDEVGKREMKDALEATMRLFSQQQEQAIATLREQTRQIGADANNLAQALKGDSKTQGDWGEMILDTLLEASGLRKGEEYFVQESVKGDDGANKRPDVIVRFPEGRNVVIDSKVSLTAYSEAMATTDEAERDRLMALHVKSVETHVKELAAKDYGSVVDGAIGFVLMFIPNESSYIAAMRRKPSLSRDAYTHKVIIISPSNLLMALQLAYNLWQYDRQNKNVAAIVDQARKLYEKMATFQGTYEDIRKRLRSLTESVEKGDNQLQSGQGNMIGMTEKLRNMGVTPTKLLKQG